MDIKNTIRKTLNFLHLDLTKNLEYDRLTTKIINQEIGVNSNCIDVGCHKGEILDIILKNSTQGKNFGFEPIPSFYNHLLSNYQGRATIYPYALADEEGTTTFKFVKNAPAYSGIKEREYAVDNPDIEEITVEKKKLDDVIPKNIKIDLIKIDVEGGEYQVLNGARRILSEDKPIVIFEHGLGASEFYGTTPLMVFELLADCGLSISTLRDFKNKSPLTQEEFEKLFYNRKEYYFIAH